MYYRLFPVSTPFAQGPRSLADRLSGALGSALLLLFPSDLPGFWPRVILTAFPSLVDWICFFVHICSFFQLVLQFHLCLLISYLFLLLFISRVVLLLYHDPAANVLSLSKLFELHSPPGQSFCPASSHKHCQIEFRHNLLLCIYNSSPAMGATGSCSSATIFPFPLVPILPMPRMFSLTCGRRVSIIDPEDKGESQIQMSSSDLPPLTTTTERKLMAKVDWHVIPCLCVMYLLAFLDRYAFFLDN